MSTRAKYDYVTGKRVEPKQWNLESYWKDYYCEKCGRKENISCVGMDLTIFGYSYLCSDCATTESESCMKSCPEAYGFDSSEYVRSGYRND